MAPLDPASLARVSKRLASLPSIALPTDYPRPPHSAANKVVEASVVRTLDDRAASALVRLGFHEDEEAASAYDEGREPERPTPFHLLLTAFLVLLHRYTGETDIVVATSSPSNEHVDPLLLRARLQPGDSFWGLVRSVGFLERYGPFLAELGAADIKSHREAEADHIPYETLLAAVGQKESDAADAPYAPLFRVRFLDETDKTESSFLQSTALTTDLTIAVRLGDSVGPPSGSGSGATTPSAPGSVTPTTSLHSSFAPSAVSLTVLYNSLLFTSARINILLDHLSLLLTQAAVRPLDPIGSTSLLNASQRAALPDPKADLEWCGWRGAITDIFAANAAAQPSHPCIVESLPSTDPVPLSSLANGPAPNRIRTFSYQQIHHASNVLAHHLVALGVKREEVVTVYSTRNVDLVVAVMGVLKAGATFSVIDPAYPESRQRIYLDVARPRALIVLRRAGQLLPPVRKFVAEKLQIRTEVPALEMQEDGSLLGSAGSEGADVLAHVQDKAATETGVALGPDSIGTLSFTSGSTGIPKGVRGRHFSLTHFFPWMAQIFGLGPTSRFTMLSGIAHDPIQRDIFTPLFLGAELHIPTAEDIGTPGRLAEWMADSEVTVTHLTPAMGQLLSAQATRQIPSLRNAFFVGDILTKRDCSRLQQLAANVCIINMFGTTETQRAVSYFAIPSLSVDSTFLASRKDIMPAGKGMINVQLLVVNRNDRTKLCGVGEMGEIYVRSGGLSEGYLGPPEVSAEKFIANWFTDGVRFEDSISSSGHPHAAHWRGVRDRMYRTGDLGRYDAEGAVECTGRADDQIKIRGFRIELGEIDTHLSQHPLVRENVTLVRRDKDEEKVLVSYFVPMQGPQLEEMVSSSEEEGEEEEARGPFRGVRKYRRLVKSVREYLKTKLPSYSVPTLFVPLTRMPLNPNGKIDKPALPFPDTATIAALAAPSSTAARAQKTTTEATIHDIWKRLLPGGPGGLPLDESFFDLGGHSILATRLVFEIRKTFVVNAPLGIVFDNPTIRALAREIDVLRNGDFGLAGEASAASTKANFNRARRPSYIPNGDGQTFSYANDAAALMKTLPSKFQPPDLSGSNKTVLLTGATGFLGAFILTDLLGRSDVASVICHVRAQSNSAGLQRLKESSESRGCWDERWVQDHRVRAVHGDLESPRLGVDSEDWQDLVDQVDAIVHNGALVHWVYPYSKLRAANVQSTLATVQLASLGKPKTYTFVSSTAVLEKAHYVALSDAIVQKGGKGLPEDDSLDVSATGLTSGYGQTKWVGERIVREAGRRGLQGGVIRPAYVVGDSTTAVTNTDDFLWRLVKGCIQIGLVPDINNTVNMLPVDHVARCTATCALSPPGPLAVYNLTARPLPRFNTFLGALTKYGWSVETEGYVSWRTRLEQHVLKVQDNALFPLLHFVLDDLPTSTKTAELDDANTVALLRRAQGPDSATVGETDMGKYLAWLVAVGFLDPPGKKGKLALPEVGMGAKALKAVGRSGH